MTRWGHLVAPYGDGPFVSQYAAGVELIDDLYDDHGRLTAEASQSRALGRTLSILTPVLAAAAGLSTLPPDVSDAVTAAAAFGAAAVSGATAAFDPARTVARSEETALRLELLRHDVERLLRWVNTLDSPDELERVEQRLAVLQSRRKAILARKPIGDEPPEDGADTAP